MIKRRIMAVLAMLVVLIGAAFAGATPAQASGNAFGSYVDCQAMMDANYQGYYPYVSGDVLGEARVCIDNYSVGSQSPSGYDCYSPSQFVTSNCLETTTSGLRIQLHDWTNNGHSLHLQVQVWGDSSWKDWSCCVDAYGGPASQYEVFWTASNMMIDYAPSGFKYIRLYEEGTGAFRYIFKSTGAGGCGYEGITSVGYCPVGSY